MARLRTAARTALLPLKRFEQALHLVDGQNVGQTLRHLRQRQPRRGVAFGVILGHAKPVKTLHHRRSSAHRRGGIALREQMLLIRHDGLARHLRELLDALRGQEITVGFQGRPRRPRWCAASCHALCAGRRCIPPPNRSDRRYRCSRPLVLSFPIGPSLYTPPRGKGRLIRRPFRNNNIM